MAAPALRNTIYSEFSDHSVEHEDGEFEREEFFTGDRICPPRPQRSSLTKLVSWLVILGAFYGGWSLWRDRPAWIETVAADASALWTALNPKNSHPVQPEQAANTPPPVPEQAVAETEVADAPGWEAGTAVAAVTTDAATAESDDTATAGATPAAPVPQQPSPPRTDRYEKQAEAVGLNPDLSRATLKSLTEADFRNAGIAIKTALSETPESEVFTWPAKPKPSLAQFEVRFVPGAADSCRRYVVTVTKDRWSTTAPPMEKCGVASPSINSNKS